MSNIPMLNDKGLIDQLPGYICWKDKQSRYLKGNAQLAKLLGFKCSEELIGITDYDIRCDAAAHADLYVEEDQRLQNTGYLPSSVCIGRYANDQPKVLLGNKSLFFDENSKPLGTVAYAIELDNRILKDSYLLYSNYVKQDVKKNQVIYYLNSEYQGIELSTRQAQCLFYLLRGKTAKEIAKLLHLSSRTVEDYLSTIKSKMDCTNKAQLIEKAIDLGFLGIIPPGIEIGASFFSTFKL